MRLAHQIRDAEPAWAALTRALTLHLETLERGEFLIIAQRGRNRFVQVAAGGHGDFRLETVSNFYLEPLGDPLTARDFARLEALGWRRPTQLPPEDTLGAPQPYGSCNFWCDADGVTRVAPLARMLVRTLREVHHVRHPRQLSYTAFHRTRGAMLLPTLGLPRQPEPEPMPEEIEEYE